MNLDLHICLYWPQKENTINPLTIRGLLYFHKCLKGKGPRREIWGDLRDWRSYRWILLCFLFFLCFLLECLLLFVHFCFFFSTKILVFNRPFCPLEHFLWFPLFFSMIFFIFLSSSLTWERPFTSLLKTWYWLLYLATSSRSSLALAKVWLNSTLTTNTLTSTIHVQWDWWEAEIMMATISLPRGMEVNFMHLYIPKVSPVLSSLELEFSNSVAWQRCLDQRAALSWQTIQSCML